ncbi:type 2 lantipeptide synthetase LanM [Streptomyces sp. RKND-216]|nr:type 2 lantipeptide synthetase LanM [Streptomyces sp. RKND-216]
MRESAVADSVGDVTNPRSFHDPAGEGLAPYWWARGLTLRDRLHAGAAEAVTAATGAELDDWRRRTRTLDPDGAMALRLDALQLGEGELAALASEPAARLAGRSELPSWARFVADALADAPAAAPEAGPDGDWRAAFAQVFAPLVRAAALRLQAGVPQDSQVVDAARVNDRFSERLGRRLAEPAARTLVLELHRAREAGRLSGADPRTRFADFVRRTGGRQDLCRLFADYPVLARLLAQLCLQTSDATAEVLERYRADRDALRTTLFGGHDPGPVVEVDLGQGDTHDRGRSVAKLRFASGARVVYKPRSTAQHAPLDRMIHWLNGKVPGLALQTLTTLDRPGYGWVEHVERRPCDEDADVDRFYRRQGALLALLHAVEGVDMHCENLIACADQPVLVDVETLLHPSVPPATTAGSDPAAVVFAASVHRTCVLPQPMFGENGALDVSALGGSSGGTYPTYCVTWADPCTDLMRLVRRPQSYAGADNLPARAGADADPGAYEAALLSGFRAGYDALTAHRDELLAPGGPLSACGEAQLRLIARPTRLYGTLLEESTHPELLRDALDRDAVLAALHLESEGDELRKRLVEAEIADLWQGDVPLFRHRPQYRHAWTSDGTRLTGLLVRSGLQSAHEKVRDLSEVGRHQQEWLISSALAVHRSGPQAHRSGTPLPSSPPAAAVGERRLMAAACGIADEIVGRAVHRDDRANWLGMEPVDGAHWSVLPMGAGLAHGYTGPALFLAQLGALTGVARYTELAADAARPLPLLTRALADDPRLARAVGIGGFNGLGGLCYALARLGTLLGGTAGDGLADALTAWAAAGAAAAEEDDGPTGLGDGTAGALVAALAVHRETGLPHAASLADDFAARLLPAAEAHLAAPAVPPSSGGGSPHGFADGLAGVGWALARYAARDGRRTRYAEVARAVHRTALQRARRAGDDHSWCSGMAGALLPTLELGPVGQESSADVGPWLKQLAATPVGADLSLCHGELGVVEALHLLRTSGNTAAGDLLRHRSGLVLGALDQCGPRCGTPEGTRTPGLLSGLAGIGYALLRLGADRHVPSVLLLDTPPRPEPGAAGFEGHGGAARSGTNSRRRTGARGGRSDGACETPERTSHTPFPTPTVM